MLPHLKKTKSEKITSISRLKSEIKIISGYLKSNKKEFFVLGNSIDFHSAENNLILGFKF